MSCMVVTLLVSQLPMFWLKLWALTNMLAMVVTELVSQLLMFPLKLEAPLNTALISVTPDVHDLARSPSLEVPTRASRPFRSRFVYVTPLTTATSPTRASRQRTVTPLAAIVNPMQLSGRDGFCSVHAPALAPKAVQMEPTVSTFHEDRSWLKAVAP